MSEHERSDAVEDIMCATYRALCENGYADLTMQDIADETDKSKAALHYHFDSKHELLVTFLEYLYEDFEERTAPDVEDPDDRLRAFLDDVLSPPEDGREEFATAILEIKAQGPYDDDFRERLLSFDERLRAVVHECVSEGVESGVYRDVDPAAVAAFVASTVQGAHTRRASVGADATTVRESLDDYLDGLRRDGA